MEHDNVVEVHATAGNRRGTLWSNHVARSKGAGHLLSNRVAV